MKNVETGELQATTTTASGEYSIAVSPGTYDVFASPIGYVAFARRQLVVQAGSSTRADGVLGDNPNAGTPGEIPFLYRGQSARPPSSPAPKTSDGKPDLSGVWFPRPDLEPEVPQYLPGPRRPRKIGHRDRGCVTRREHLRTRGHGQGSHFSSQMSASSGTVTAVI